MTLGARAVGAGLVTTGTGTHKALPKDHKPDVFQDFSGPIRPCINMLQPHKLCPR
jgi:hypothetical protein